MKKMIVRIDKEGKTTIRVEGAVGEECLEFTRLVERAVGEVSRREMTEDYERLPENVIVRQEETL